MNEGTPVFVYGTLRKGMHLHDHLKKSKFMGFGYVEGYTLHSMGGFPAVKPSKDKSHKVYGELYMVNSYVLKEVDFIEGYIPGSGSNVYERTPETAIMDKERRDCFIYVFNLSIEGRAVVSCGDWVKYSVPPRIKKENIVRA